MWKEINEDMPFSLSTFLLQDVKCDHDNKIGYARIECINGKCIKNCQIVDIAAKLKGLKCKHNKPFLLSYYQFERVEANYYNKYGTLKTHEQLVETERIPST